MIHSNTRDYLTLLTYVYKLYVSKYMYKPDLALDNQQWLTCHKTKPNQTKLYQQTDCHQAPLTLILCYSCFESNVLSNLKEKKHLSGLSKNYFSVTPQNWGYENDSNNYFTILFLDRFFSIIKLNASGNYQIETFYCSYNLERILKTIDFVKVKSSQWFFQWITQTYTEAHTHKHKHTHIQTHPHAHTYVYTGSLGVQAALA